MTPIFKGLSYRTVINHYGLILCDGTACGRRWSVNRHLVGKADTMGHIHWSRADAKMTRKGLRELLVTIAAVPLKFSTRNIPTWQQLYESNIWAWKEGKQTWRVLFTQQMSHRDRELAWWLARNEPHLRAAHFAAYQWMKGRGHTWRL